MMNANSVRWQAAAEEMYSFAAACFLYLYVSMLYLHCAWVGVWGVSSVLLRGLSTVSRCLNKKTSENWREINCILGLQML